MRHLIISFILCFAFIFGIKLALPQPDEEIIPLTYTPPQSDKFGAHINALIEHFSKPKRISSEAGVQNRNDNSVLLYYSSLRKKKPDLYALGMNLYGIEVDDEEILGDSILQVFRARHMWLENFRKANVEDDFDPDLLVSESTVLTTFQLKTVYESKKKRLSSKELTEWLQLKTPAKYLEIEDEPISITYGNGSISMMLKGIIAGVTQPGGWVMILVFLFWTGYFVFGNFYDKPMSGTTALVFILASISTLALTPLLYDAAYSLNLFVGKHLFLYCVLIIGFIEEFVKILPVVILLFIFRKRQFTSSQIVVLGIISACTFAMYENFLKLDQNDLSTIRSRGIYTGIAHFFWTTICTYAYTKFESTKSSLSIGRAIGAFALACLLHGVFDFFIFQNFDQALVGFSLLMIAVGFFWVNRIWNNCLNLSLSATHITRRQQRFLDMYVAYGIALILLAEFLSWAQNHGVEQASRHYWHHVVGLAAVVIPLFLLMTNYSIIPGKRIDFSFNALRSNRKINSVIGKNFKLHANSTQIHSPRQLNITYRYLLKDGKVGFHCLGDDQKEYILLSDFNDLLDQQKKAIGIVLDINEKPLFQTRLETYHATEKS